MTDEEVQRYDELKYQPHGKPFREFLNESANLLTVFGILNALLLFAMQMKDNLYVAIVLFACFYTLSVLVWWHVIMLALDCSNDSFSYSVFYYCACTIELALSYHLFISFSPLFIGLAAFAVFFLLVYWLSMLIVRVLVNKLAKIKSYQNRKKVLALIFALSMIFVAFLFWLLLHFCQNEIGEFLSDVFESTGTVKDATPKAL